MIKIICNNCGKELSANDKRFSLSSNERYTGEKLIFGFNLCDKCQKSFLPILDVFVNCIRGNNVHIQRYDFLYN